METKDSKKYYKYRSKWSGKFEPLQHLWHVNSFRKFGYEVIQISKDEYLDLKK